MYNYSYSLLTRAQNESHIADINHRYKVKKITMYVLQTEICPHEKPTVIHIYLLTLTNYQEVLPGIKLEPKSQTAFCESKTKFKRIDKIILVQYLNRNE